VKNSASYKRALGRFWRLLPHGGTRGIVLQYHSVGASPRGLDVISFRRQMEWLARNGAVVDLPDLIAGRWPQSTSDLTCAITFDDGYACVYENALPVLQEFGMSATIYLMTSGISSSVAFSSDSFPGLYSDERMLTWQQVRSLHEQRVAIGSHLVHHEDMSRLSRMRAEEELRDSKRVIEDRLGTTCNRFAYPFSHFTSEAVQLVGASGYTSAVTALHHRFRQGEQIDPLRIGRADVSRSYSFDDFQKLLRGDWDFLGGYQRLRRPLLQWNR